MSQPQTVVIGSSPKAGSGRRRWVLANVERDLRAKGFHVIASHSLDEIVHSATHAFAKNELRAVIAAGGDGTISLLAQTLPANYPILPLPLGTENLLARYYGCDWRPDQVMAAIELGEIRKIDAGIANGRLFLLMATAGFDAEVARLLHLKRKGHISHLSYCKPILSALRTYPYPEISVRVTGGVERENLPPAAWAMVFNMPCYAMSLPLSPTATEQDGTLDLCLMQRPGIAAGLWYASNVCLRRHHRLRDVCIRQATSVELTSNQPVPYQLDGDFAGYLPLNIAMVTDRVTLLLPPQAQRL